jgi:hypothetical protein
MAESATPGHIGREELLDRLPASLGSIAKKNGAMLREECRDEPKLLFSRQRSNPT